MCCTKKINIFFCKYIAKFFDILFTIIEDRDGQSYIVLQNARSMNTPHMHVEFTDNLNINEAIHSYRKFRDEISIPSHSRILPNGTIITIQRDYERPSNTLIVCNNGIYDGRTIYYLMGVWGEGSLWKVSDIEYGNSVKCNLENIAIKIYWYDPSLV